MKHKSVLKLLPAWGRVFIVAVLLATLITSASAQGPSEFVEFQSILTSGARDWTFFPIGESHYLVVANSHNGVTALVDSKIYIWD